VRPKPPRLGRLWLIVSPHEPVGCIAVTFGFSLEHQGRDAFIDDFFIGPRFRDDERQLPSKRLFPGEAR